MNFNNEQYKNISEDLIHDIFYSNISARGSISSIRQYTEILIRKILDKKEKDRVTVGDCNIIKALKTKSNNNSLITESIMKIKKLGNKYTHTNFTGCVSEEDKDEAFDALLDVSAFLFVDYFSMYKFGTNNLVMSQFSLLPPIIRYRVLSNLYNTDSSNIYIIDKLCLAILKSKGPDEAFNWIEINKYALENISLDNEKSFQMFEMTMYDSCLDKIQKLGDSILVHGTMYETFEEAICEFHKHGKIEGNTPEIDEFNNVMELIYLGRR